MPTPPPGFRDIRLFLSLETREEKQPARLLFQNPPHFLFLFSFLFFSFWSSCQSEQLGETLAQFLPSSARPARSDGLLLLLKVPKSVRVRRPLQREGCRCGGAMWLRRTLSWTPSSGNLTVKVRAKFCCFEIVLCAIAFLSPASCIKLFNNCF